MSINVWIQRPVDTKRGILCHIDPPPSVNKKKLQTETCELFSAYLAQSQEGDCHEREEKASSFYEEPFLETMNFETLVNWKIVNFFPWQKDILSFVLIFSHVMCERSRESRLVHCQKSKNLLVFMQHRSTRSVCFVGFLCIL